MIVAAAVTGVTAALSLYRGLTAAGAPLVRAHLRRRAARGKEDPARLGERFGEASRPRPPGPLIWLHAASVGETASVLPLVARMLENPALSALLTSGTTASARLAGERLPPRAVHQYAPVDLPGAARRFLDHWRPALGVFVESELWPNLILEAQARAVPLAMVQARMSERSWRRWRCVPGAARRLLGAFRPAIAQTRADAERYRRLGAPHAPALGTLKYSADPLPADAGELRAWRRALADRPLWVAASTHPGVEEDSVLAAHDGLRARLPGLLTVIVPRRPEHGGALATAAAARGFRAVRRSAAPAAEASAGADVYIADTFGELGLFYRLAPVAFVGGTLSRRGGHNPIEPVRLGCAVVTGPDLRNFAGVADDLRASQALATAADGEELTRRLARLLRDGPARARLAARQTRAVADGASVLDAVMDALAPVLPRRDAA